MERGMEIRGGTYEKEFTTEVTEAPRRERGIPGGATKESGSRIG
jgi:hypothetical protein